VSGGHQILLVTASAVVAATYVLPTLIAVVRPGRDAWRVLVINVCLGWTIIGWVVALRVASRPARHAPPACASWSPWSPGRPEAARGLPAAPSTYLDGTYLISEDGDARTWAICAGGRWGIAYELAGVQRTGAWVDTSDVPVDILAHALTRQPERRS
jgi:hypothetical protein